MTATTIINTYNHSEMSSFAKNNDRKMEESPHYFAIGAMMNPVSVGNRSLKLEEGAAAQPAILLDHQLVFYGCHGFAEVVPKLGATVHGVLYLNVPAAQMKELDHVERDYIRKTCPAKLYSGEILNVSVYCRSALTSEECGDHEKDQLPTERYLQVLWEGAQHYGVDPSYVQFLQNHPCRPRPCPCDYKTFPLATPNALQQTMTRTYVTEKGTGWNGHPLLLTCGDKVIEFSRTSTNGHLVDEFRKTLSQHGDRKVELAMSRLLYDPKYGCPSCFSAEHLLYTEHLMCDVVIGLGEAHNWKVVAKLVEDEDEDE